MKTHFFSSLDGLRFLCIAVVLWHHSPLVVLESPLAKRGFLGVDMFFVLSGFLIVTLLLREREKFGEISLKNFYIRRSLRIFPIYFIFIFSSFVISFFLPGTSSLKKDIMENWFYLVTFTVNYATESKGIFSHLWSLSIEEQFYLIWPFLEWKGRRWIRPLILLLLLTCILRDAGILATVTPFINSSPFSRSLAWGVALAHLLHSEKGYNFTVRILNGRWASLITGLMLIGILMLPGIREGWKAISTSFLLTCFVASIVVQPNHILASFFRCSPVAYFGSISYGIYLYHIPMIVAIEIICLKIGVSLWGFYFTILYLGSLIGFSSVSFEYFEKPILRQRKRFVQSATGINLDSISKVETAT